MGLFVGYLNIPQRFWLQNRIFGQNQGSRPQRELLSVPGRDFRRVRSLKLTWPLKMVVSNRNLLFQGSIFRGYVSFREGM